MKTFFIEILEVNSEIAEKDACLIEHVISPVTMEKFTAYLEDNVDLGYAKNNAEKCCIKARQFITLDQLRSGIKAKVVRIASKGELKRRMMDMGIIPGSELLVERTAPMGDPLEIKIKGYCLALRKTEAKNIIVEVVG